jgi:ribosomal protein S18 acetylase RimI-like enzyme
VIADSMDGRHAFTATVDGRLAGIAGYKDAAGSLLDIGPAAMTRIFGFFGGWARLLALSVFARPVEPGVLLMDGIVVDKMQRSGGIGTRLLDAVIGHAAAHGYHAVRLDVVDTNPRARSLYERAGFVPVDAQRTPYLRWLFGFSGVTTMHRVLDGGDAAV